MPYAIAEVLLDYSLDKPLDYAIPKECTKVQIGMRVEVPLRSGTALGTISSLKKISAFQNLKPFLRLLNKDTFIPPELFQLAAWISQYYVTPLNKVLKSVLPPSIRKESKYKMQTWIKPTVNRTKLQKICEEMRLKFPAQVNILDFLLLNPKGMFLSELIEKTGFSRGPIKTLLKKGLISEHKERIDRSAIFEHSFFPVKPKVLNEEQQKACDSIVKTLGSFCPHLIHGVTGSGKTEVYLQVIKKALDRKLGVLYLVPEISLTSQTIERFKGRFGETKIAVLHHRLSNGEKHDTWHNILQGNISIVIGARSSLFSPFPKLGVIIVDEEHESSYKQSDEAPKYHARDMAIVRAKLAQCPVVLGSATPSIESYTNAIKGKYTLHTLTKRPTTSQLPEVSIVDMRNEFKKSGGFTLFSQKLLHEIKKRFNRGEQTLLFLNRRGYHTSAKCPQCSTVINCPHCELALTYHKGEQTMACHLCDYQIPTPRSCPTCKADESLKFKGAGTELIQKSLHAIFPEIRTLRLDADTTRHKGSHEKLYKKFKSGKADVLIGTQMIAKGLHFPMVTLACVLNLDGSLNIPDFRASESVFQLLTQVAGRSGRGDQPGQVIIQTQLPDHQVIQQGSKQDFNSFYQEELKIRTLFAFPPAVQLIKCSFSGSSKADVEKSSMTFHHKLSLQLDKGVELLPIVPCGYVKIAGRFRYQFLIKTPKILKVVRILEEMRTQFKKKGDLRLSIDVDPISTFF